MSATFTINDISEDRHGSTYVAELMRHPEATADLCSMLSDHDNVVRLVTASELGLSALSGVASRLEATPSIGDVLADREGSARFRQAIGVAIRIRMEALGWNTTGTKGVVVNAQHFGKAERYQFGA